MVKGYNQHQDIRYVKTKNDWFHYNKKIQIFMIEVITSIQDILM